MGKILRIVAIVLMGLTAIFTILGGAGTTCVALAAERWPDSMGALVPYKWLYVIFVLATIGAGVMMVRAVVLLARGRGKAYRCSLTALIAGIVIGAIHMAVSRALRGSSMPVDAVTYTAVLTLIVFLLLRIPGIWVHANFDNAPREGDSTGPTAAAITLLLSGPVVLSVQLWAGPSHTFHDANWADAWHFSMGLLGWGFILAGLSVLTWIRMGFHRFLYQHLCAINLLRTNRNS